MMIVAMANDESHLFALVVAPSFQVVSTGNLIG